MNKILDIFISIIALYLLYNWFGEFFPLLIVVITVIYCFWTMMIENDER